MTNPNNIGPISTPFSPEAITAVAYFRPGAVISSGSAWFGLSSGSIYIAHVQDRGSSQLIFRSHLQTAQQNYCVGAIIPAPKPGCVIGHWVGGNGQPGPVQVIYPGAVRAAVVEKASNVLYLNGTVAIVLEKKLSLYKFQSNALVFEDEVELMGHPAVCELCDKYFLYYFDGVYYQMNLENMENVKLLTTNIKNPFIYRVGEKRVYLGDNDFIRVSEVGDGKEPGQLQYDKLNRQPVFMLPNVPSCIYHFFKNSFIRVDLKSENTNEAQVFEVKEVVKASMIGESLLVVTPTSVLLVGTMDDPAILAQKIVSGNSQEIEDLLSKLPKDQASHIALTIFDQLWKMQKFNEAFQLISKIFIVSNINHIVSLVPLIFLGDTPIISNDEDDQLETLQPLAEDNKAYMEPMMNFLSFTRDSMLNNSKYAYEFKSVNTALAQCYASFSKTRELDKLIKEGQLDIKALEQFISKRQKLFQMAPALAIVKANSGDVPDAIRIWRQLDNALKQRGQINTMFISEASYALQMSKDSRNLATDLDWIYERDPNKPELAVNAILSVNHDSKIVDDWIKSKGLDNLRLRYSVFIVTQPSTARGSSLANETFITLLNILNTIDSPDFDIQKLQFTQTFLANGANANKDAAKEEIVEYELQILRQHANSIVHDEVKSCITDKIDQRIVLGLYCIKGDYETGIKILTEGDNFPEDLIQNFCREAPESQKAFSVLLHSIPSNELISKRYQFLQNNIEYMDLAELVSIIPQTLRVKEVQVLLKKCYNLLQTRLNSLNTQISISKSIQTDLSYQKAAVLSNFCVVDKDSQCSACGEIIQEGEAFVMAPGGINQEIYHTKCKPNIFA